MDRLTRARAFAQRHAKWLNRVWLLAILLFVAWRLARIGWGEVLANVPPTPWFYLIYAASFMVLPFSERVIFGIVWPTSPRASMAALLRKRAMNSMVIGLSGDLSFFLWARRHLGLPERRLLAGIKDSSILSGLSSALVTAALVAAFFATGSAGVIDRFLAGHRAAMWAAIAALAILVPVGLRFRNRILWIGGGQAARVLAVHMLRGFLVLGLQLAQWAVVLPQVPIETWLLFLTVQLLIGQLPLLPNRDFLFLAVGVELTGAVGVDRAALASMLVTMTFLKQATNLATLVLTSFTRQGREMPASAVVPDA